MSTYTLRAVLAAAALIIAAPVMAQQAASPSAQAHCGGLFCDLYYASNTTPPGVPEPPPGHLGSTRLACHDFVCGMFGGRTVEEQPAAAVEPAPAAAAPVKPKRVAKVKKPAGSVATAEATAH